MDIIYEARGRAAEFAPLAATIYSGCVYRCKYCFVPGALRIDREKFHETATPRNGVVERLAKDAMRIRGDPREILLSFSSDPYPPCETALQVTRRAIKVLIDNDLTFTILTKAAWTAVRDFDLLSGYEKCSFGQTICQAWNKAEWEPASPAVSQRIQTLGMAKDVGIKVWVSLEPVINPAEALHIIRWLLPIVDHWKIGKINHMPEIEEKHDWLKFREDARALLEEVGADYYFKKSLTSL